MKKENDFMTIFIFPFKLETTDGSEVRPEQAARRLCANNLDVNGGWVRKSFNIDSPERYNEYYYFHPFLRNALFYREDNKEDKGGVVCLTRKDVGLMEVEHCFDGERRTMTTDVTAIDLHLYENQVGLLSITTEKSKEDVSTGYDEFLKYNDIARRVYPPYLGKDNTQSLKVDPFSQLLPSRIVLYTGDGKIFQKEDFPDIDLHDKETQKKDTLYLSNIVKKLLRPLKLKEKAGNKGKKIDDIYFTSFTDDRMFVVSYYSDHGMSDRLKAMSSGSYMYETSDDWYRFIFVDGGSMNIENDRMKGDLIRQHTYARWANYGTLYGFSRYSFVLVCDDSYFSKKVLKQHMKTIYYQMALILLFQRAMLLKFSEDITNVTQKFSKKSFSGEALKLQEDFISFNNTYWFYEVTPQEQGIEMYDQWLDTMRHSRLFNEIQLEIQNLASYVDNRIENERNERMKLLTEFGVPLAVIGLLLSFWQLFGSGFDKFANIWSPSALNSLNFKDDLINNSSILNSFILLIPPIIVICLLSCCFIRKQRKK